MNEGRFTRLQIWFGCVVVFALLPILFHIIPMVVGGREICWREIGGAPDVTLIGIIILADGFGRLCSRIIQADDPSLRKQLVFMVLSTFVTVVVGGRRIRCADPLHRETHPRDAGSLDTPPSKQSGCTCHA